MINCLFDPKKIRQLLVGGDSTCRGYWRLGVMLFGFLLFPSNIFPADGAIATQHPLASKAGFAMLEGRGNAVDAAVASAMVLSVVEPFNSGLGGGGFLVFYEKKSGHLTGLNFRERAPGAFALHRMPESAFRRAEMGGWWAVATPGAMAGLAKAHANWGVLPWATVLSPAIELAKDGFVVDARLAGRLLMRQADFALDPQAKALFYPRGRPLETGEILRQPDLARTLESIAKKGPRFFYRGPVAKAAAKAVAKHGGFLSADDFSAYTVKPLPLLREKFGNHEWVLPGLPSSAGHVMGSILRMMQGDQRTGDFSTFVNLAPMAQAMGLAFDDRAVFLGDADFENIDASSFHDPTLALERRKGFHCPIARSKPLRQKAPETKTGETSHVVVVDGAGNAVSLTNSLNTAFGAAVMIPGTGIIMNNTMDDFGYPNKDLNVFALKAAPPNFPKPGKTPLSSMAPTLIFERGNLILVIGGPGGPRIITSVLLTALSALESKEELSNSLAKPRFHVQSSDGTIDIEKGHYSKKTLKALSECGFKARDIPPWGNIQAIRRLGEGWEAASDPRGMGLAIDSFSKNGDDSQ